MTFSRLPLIFSLVLSVSCAKSKDDTAAGADQPEWLFVVHADQATLSDDVISLTDVAPQVIAFTDRPDRLFGTITMEDLAAAWTEGADSFADDPPNAILNGVITDDNGATTQCAIEVELMAAPAAGEGEQWSWPVVELGRFDGCPVGEDVTLNSASLFVDVLVSGCVCADGCPWFFCN
jgi:hypothetical protein